MQKCATLQPMDTAGVTFTKLTDRKNFILLGKMVCFALVGWLLIQISVMWMITPMLSWILPFNGVVVGTALVSRRRLNVPPWAVFVPAMAAMFLFRMQYGLSVSMSFLWTALNALEYIGIWYFLHKEFSNQLPISLPALSKMVVVGLFAIPACSALGYCWMQVLMDAPRWDMFWPYWLRNASSIAIFTTSILLLSNEAIVRLKNTRWRTSFLFATLLNCMMLGVIFSQESLPYLFLFAPTLMFLVVKGRGLGAATAMISAMLFAYGFTYMESGPLQLIHGHGSEQEYHKMIVLHLFLIAVSSVAVAGAVIFEDNIRLMRQLKEKEARMSELASRDPLTGLLNRRGLYGALQPYFDSHTIMGAILLDIDHFKRFNDLYGHVRGDECLTQIAGCLHELHNFHPNVVTARLGGEEFLVVFPERNKWETKKLAEQLLKCVADQKIEHKGSDKGFVTLSLGVSETTPEETTITSLVQRADHALYDAKGNGRNQVKVSQ